MSKLIVTHISPDFDGIPAIWLLRKFHPDFSDAKIAYVPAGESYNREPPDSNPDIINVDTGGGRFDHHQNNEFTCGAKLVYEWLISEGYIDREDQALSRMIQIITELDHGYDLYRWCEAENDRYDFSLNNILVGWKFINSADNQKYIDLTIGGLEAVYRLMQQKVKAEKEIEGGRKFKTPWGRGVAVTSVNPSILDTAIRRGYAVVLTKDPGRGHVRVTGSNKFNVDLTAAYAVARKRDPEATWFLHASKVLLRNGSTRNPNMRPTKLTIEEMVKILEKA